MDAPNALSDVQLDALSITEPYIRRAEAIAHMKAAARVRLPFQMIAADYAGKVPFNFTSPIKGDVVKIEVIGQVVLVGAAANLAVKVGTTAIVGLGAAGTDVVVTTLAAGAIVTKKIDPVATSAVEKGGRVQVVSEGTTTSGALNGYIEIQPRA